MFRCSICRKVVSETSKFFPFCCQRCRLLDLGKWLDEDYKVSRPLKPWTDAEADEIEDEEEAPTDGQAE